MNRSAPTRRAACVRRVRRDRGVEREVVQDVAGEEEEVLLHEADRWSAAPPSESSRMSTPSTVIRPRSGS